MIPANISFDHVLSAINDIDRSATPIPNRRGSKRYNLLFNGKLYPPKYVISLANKYANGIELAPSLFSGGDDTNKYLEKLGFEIIRKGMSPPMADHPKGDLMKKKDEKLTVGHNERCARCKQVVGKMLESIYGKVDENYKFDIGVNPDDFAASAFYNRIKDIHSALRAFRGRRDFIYASNLPRVDFYIPNPGFIVEFDESQHFTACRREALKMYPDTLKIGFINDKWIKLCEEIKAKDNDPVYRDEQRAWYDTLRDFLPTVLPLCPTVRLYSDDMKWCDLNPNKKSDIDTFKELLKGGGIEVRPQSCDKAYEAKGALFEIAIDNRQSRPKLARIIIKGEWRGDVNTSKKLLKEVCDSWPNGIRAVCLVTCGAFLNFGWPDLSKEDIGNNRAPKKEALNLLISKAQEQCDLLIDEEMRKELAAHTDYVTIGVDSYKDKISTSCTKISQDHIELVALINLKTGQYHWTGKSYLTIGQERKLVRIQDLRTHFIEISIGKAMILGCHDLTLFNPRSIATTKAEWRIKIRDDFFKIIKEEQPTIILHHPHTTESPKTWGTSWGGVTRTVPTVTNYISAGRYIKRSEKSATLNEVLQNTKCGSTIDFIIESK